MKKILLFLILFASISFADATFLNMSTTSVPTSVQPGNAFSVEVQMDNWGTGAAKNLKVYPILEAPFTFRPGSDASKSYLELIGRRSLRSEFHFIAASDAVSANYPITFRYDYETETGARSFGERDVNINLEGSPMLELLAIRMVPDTAKPGNSAKLVLTVKNIGTGPAKNIRAQWSSGLTTVKPLGGDVSYASEIKPGGQISLEQSVIIPSSTTAGIYSLPITISYENEKNIAQTDLSRSATILVSSDIELKSFLSSSENIIADKKGAATITIANTGPSTAEYLYVQASGDGIKVKPAEDYIGNLKSDDFDSIEFEIVGPAGKHPIKLHLTYGDQFNNPYEEDREVQITILSAEEAAKDGEKDTTMYYVGGVILLAMLYYLSKKRKRHHEK